MKTYWCNWVKSKKQEKIDSTLNPAGFIRRLGVIGFNIDRVSISKIEAGARFAADYEAVAIAKALNISIEWLLTENCSINHSI